MQTRTFADELQIGGWRARHLSGEQEDANGVLCRVEPKVMDLLMELARHPGVVLTREHLLARLWPGVVVGDDTLARAVSKLRQALGDDARAPQYIETIAKRGYRLRAPVQVRMTAQAADPPPEPPPQAPAPQRTHDPSPRIALRIWVPVLGGLLALGGWALHALRPPAAVRTDPAGVPAPVALQSPDLLARAEDYYFQYTHADNLAAIALYERILAQRPDHPPALAGLANAWVQQQMRWPQGPAPAYRTLGDALAAGHLRQPAARRALQDARHLAERAVALAPELSASHKALGLVHSALGDVAAARTAYLRALALDPNAWGVLINLGDLAEIEGQSEAAIQWFERAWSAMALAYPRESARIRPWHAALGTLIADRLRHRGRGVEARQWYLRVLEEAPDHGPAADGLATLEAVSDPGLSPATGN